MVHEYALKSPRGQTRLDLESPIYLYTLDCLNIVRNAGHFVFGFTVDIMLLLPTPLLLIHLLMLSYCSIALTPQAMC